MSLRHSRRRRHIKSEINMVPFIDVMLVLLIIFMISAPLLPTGVVDLPSMGRAKQAPQKVIEVLVKGDNAFELRIDGRDLGGIALDDLAERIRSEQERTDGGAQESPVIISARKKTEYQTVIRVMDVLQQGGVGRVGLSVKTTGG
jgi:biopolymer transport protein TolR